MRLVAIATLATLGLIVAGVLTNQDFNTRVTRILIDPEIESALIDLTRNAEPGGAGGVVLADVPLDPRYMRPTSGRYYQVSEILAGDRLRPVFGSRSLFDVYIPLSAEVTAALLHGPRGANDVAFANLPKAVDREELRVGGRLWVDPGSGRSFLFIVAFEPQEIVDRTAIVAAQSFLRYTVVAAIVIVIVTLVQAGLILGPLRRMRRDIADVRRGQADHLAREYASELRPLTEELNALLAHNREVVERARRHVGNLAHALKTPIAVLKNASGENGAGAQVVRQSVEEMEAYVERQLRRARVAARAESKAGAQASTIGYRTRVRQNLQDLTFMMEQKYDHQKAIDIELVAPEDITFRGEREDLLEMAANLLDNACKYGNSRVLVRLLSSTEMPGYLEIVVEDDGPGLSDTDIQRVMERGARLDEAAPGQGLGLSILTETVELYAGKLAFGRSPLGGLSARLILPSTD